MLGIIIGVASVITIITIGDSAKEYIVGLIRDIGGESVNITVNKNKASESDYIDDDDIEAIKKNKLISYASPMVANLSTVTNGKEDGFGAVMSGNEDFENLLRLKMVKGRFFTHYEYESQKNVAVIDTNTAKNLFGTVDVVGETINVTIENNSADFKIIGVCYLEIEKIVTGDGMNSFMNGIDSSYTGEMASNSSKSFTKIYIPSTVMINMLNESSYKSCYISSKNIDSLDKIDKVAINILSSRHNNLKRNMYTSKNISSFVDTLGSVINVFTYFLTAVGAIALIVGGIGVMNIMLVSVTERTREIGIRKSLGARTGVLLNQFLTESTIICIIGGIIGLILSVILSYAFSKATGIPIHFKIKTILFSVLFSSFIGILSGIYPALKAAKLPPIDALRR